MKQNLSNKNKPGTDKVLTNDSSVNPMFAADCEAAANIGRSPRLFAARCVANATHQLATGERIILDLCGGTGAWSEPYRKAGYDVRLVTLPKQDVRLFIPPSNVWGILAAPPCTEFSFAKHFHGKGKYKHDFMSGLAVVDACLRIVWACRGSVKWWAIENPRGYLKRWLGQPSFTFDPYEYGDRYQKKTCLWGEFSVPKKCGGEKPKMKFSMLKSKDIHPEFYGRLSRAERRAITPAGFAKAFFEANK